jgi:hypothetical protein
MKKSLSSGSEGASWDLPIWLRRAERPSIGIACSMKMIYSISAEQEESVKGPTIPTAVMNPLSRARESTTSRKPSLRRPRTLVMRPIYNISSVFPQPPKDFR